MGRRKKSGMLSDGSDSDSGVSDDSFNSQEDADSRAERRLFERKAKRPRTGGKDAAWEGIFGDEPPPQFGRGKAKATRTDWTKAPAFVSSAKASANATPADSDESGQATPRIVQEGEEEPRTMGMGMSARAFMDQGAKPASSGRMGIGAMKSMFDSGRKIEDEREEPEPEASEEPTPVPSAFGRSAASMSAFASAARSNFTAAKAASPAPSAPAHTLTNTERAHFSKISGSFGARMLANMGWAPGKGLGSSEDGLAVPIAVKVMNRGQGISSGIRSEESKREAIRKGELEEEPEVKRTKKKGPKPAQRDGWKKERRVKVKVEHKTYDQLIAEEDTTRAGVGMVLDARSGELKAVESLSELSLSTWTPSADTMQLPELRHNLRLILDVSKGELVNLVKEGKSVNERRRWSTREEERARVKKDSVGDDISRLETIQATVAEVSSTADEVRKGSVPFSALQPGFDTLMSYKTEYSAMGLDDVVVGAIDHVLAKSFANWQPFDVSSDVLLSTLKPWRKAFNLNSDPSDTMSAWESLMWNRWLPKVRSAINNEWDATDPYPAVHLFESWEFLLPGFIADNLIDQLILPKVVDAVERWRPKTQSLASILFPWLPILGERVTSVLDEAKRRVKAVLRKWNPSDGVIDELERWKSDVFSSSEWDKLMGEFVLPKLGALLRDEFTINPRAQDMGPLTTTLAWAPLIRPSHFARLFELEFFPQWLNVLYLWLVHPGYSGDEVAQWFEMWKALFPPNPAIVHGFDTGLKLMSDALELGESAPTKLQKPVFTPLPSKSKSKEPKRAKDKPKVQSATQEITFRSIAEDHIAANDLIMVPLGKSHPVTGKPLFRVGKHTDKGGAVVYFGPDAVFAQDGDAFRAVTLDELVKRAG